MVREVIAVTLETSTGRDKKLEDMSHTRGTDTSGTLGNSTPTVYRAMVHWGTLHLQYIEQWYTGELYTYSI